MISRKSQLSKLAGNIPSLGYRFFLNSGKKLYRDCRTTLAEIGVYSEPSFLIIGAPKCGTTALHSYLCEHPNILPAREKEINYFNSDKTYLCKGIDYYRSQFPISIYLRNNKMTFDASISYIYVNECPKRIFIYNPTIKMILLIRNPEDRAYSAWNMLRRTYIKYKDKRYKRPPFLNWQDNDDALAIIRRLHLKDHFPSFEDVIKMEFDGKDVDDIFKDSKIISGSCYVNYIKNYLKYFSKEQIMIIDSAELLNDPLRVLNGISKFLEIDEYTWKLSIKKVKSNVGPFNIGAYEEKIKEDTKEILRKFFRPFNEELFDLLGRKFDW